MIYSCRLLGGEEKQVTLAALTSAMRPQSNMHGQVLKSELILRGREMIERGHHKCLQVSEGRISK